MAEFLVKRGGPSSVRLIVPTAKGKATVSLKVRPHGAAGRITIPDAQVDHIDPAHARHMVRLAPVAPDEPEVTTTETPAGDELSHEESPTIPATPDALKAPEA